MSFPSLRSKVLNVGLNLPAPVVSVTTTQTITGVANVVTSTQRTHNWCC
jgi:hypothetical protein